MEKQVKDLRTGDIYYFIRFIEWYHDESTIDLQQHIDHGPHILAENDNTQIKIPMNYAEFLK